MKQEVIMKTESSNLASATVQRQETQALELVERSLSQGMHIHLFTIFPRLKGTGTQDLIWLKVVSLERS